LTANDRGKPLGLAKKVEVTKGWMELNIEYLRSDDNVDKIKTCDRHMRGDTKQNLSWKHQWKLRY
jgi:hypothetical protein